MARAGRGLASDAGSNGIASVPAAAARGAVWITAAQAVNQVLAFGVFVVLGRLLTPAEFGLVASANVIIYFLRILVNAGFSRALVQRAEISEDHIDTAFWVSIGVGVVLALLTLAGAPLLGQLFHEPGLAPVARALSALFVLAALDSTQSALIDRAMNFRVQAIRRAVASLLSSGLAVGLALAGAGVWALVAQILSFELLLVVLLWSMASWRPRLRFSAAHFGELVAFGANFVGVRVMVYLSQNVDNFLIAWILGPTPLGLYVVAYRVLLIVIQVLTLTISQVALPMFSRYQDDPVKLSEAFYTSVELGVTLGWPVFTGLAIVADQLIPFLFGAKWTASGPVMTALSLAGFVQVASTFTQNIVIAKGRVDNEFRWNIFATAVQVAVFAATAPEGILAVAIGLGIALSVLWPIRIWQVARWQLINVRRYVRTLWGPAVATVIMAAAVLIVKSYSDHLSHGAALGIEIGCGAGAYLAALPVVAPRAFSGLLRSWRLVTAGPARRVS